MIQMLVSLLQNASNLLISFLSFMLPNIEFNWEIKYTELKKSVAEKDDVS